MTGNTALRVVAGRPGDTPQLILARHVPIPVGDPQRTIIVALCDDWTTIPQCGVGCSHGADAAPGEDYGDGIDLVADWPQPAEQQLDTLDAAAVWLEWSVVSGSIPRWAYRRAWVALWRYAEQTIRYEGHRYSYGVALDRAQQVARAALAELAELDARLTHEPDAGSGGDWDRRGQLVMRVARAATLLGWSVGAGYDPEMPEYPHVVLVDLPTGQVSWHMRRVPWCMPDHPQGWDGHSRVEKAARIAAWLAGPVAAAR